MLSNISFNDFSEEVKLQNLNNKNLTILTLLSEKNKIGSTQVHKLMFLAFAEGRVILPFSFAKWSHGPYSEDLQNSLLQLKKDNLVDMKKEKVINFEKDSWIISKTGQKIIEGNKQEVAHIKKLIEKTLKEHDEGAISLEKYCYDNFFLKPKNKTDEEWTASIKQKVEDLRTILDSRKKEIASFEEIEETKRAIVLSSFDYMDHLLQKVFSLKNIDQVVQGVLLKNTEEYINLWGEVLRLAKDDSTDKIKLLLFRIREIFSFINEVASKYCVFESIFNSQEKEN